MVIGFIVNLPQMVIIWQGRLNVITFRLLSLMWRPSSPSGSSPDENVHGRRSALCSLGLPSGCWVDSPCCCYWGLGQGHQNQPSQSSLTNWGPAAPQEPSGSVAPDCDCWSTQPHRLSKYWVVALLGTDDGYGPSVYCTTQPQRLSNYGVLHLQLQLLF